MTQHRLPGQAGTNHPSAKLIEASTGKLCSAPHCCLLHLDEPGGFLLDDDPEPASA